MERAARLWGAAEALLEKIEVIAYAYEHVRSLYHRRMDAARSRLDEARWEEGRAMTPEQAVEYALEAWPKSQTPRVSTMPCDSG